VPWQEFINNNFAIFAPLKYAATKALPELMWLTTIISFSALMALITTLLVMCMDAGRTIMVIAQAGVLPPALGRINPKTQTPIAGLTLGCLISAVLALKPQFAMDIVGSGALTVAITVFIIAITVIVNRWKVGKKPGVFTAPGGYVVPVFTMAAIAIISTQLQRSAYLITLVSYSLAIIVYIIAYLTNRKNFKHLGVSNVED
jgi:basic amino acid/polyamine antiporter, APA family